MWEISNWAEGEKAFSYQLPAIGNEQSAVRLKALDRKLFAEG